MKKTKKSNPENVIKNENIEFQVTAKKVQKMSRDGLIEQNKQTGEKTIISKKEPDTSFQKKNTNVLLKRNYKNTVPHTNRNKKTRIRNALKNNKRKNSDQLLDANQGNVTSENQEEKENTVIKDLAVEKHTIDKIKSDYKNHSPTVPHEIVLNNTEKAVDTVSVSEPKQTPDNCQNNVLHKSTSPSFSNGNHSVPTGSNIEQGKNTLITKSEHDKPFSPLKEQAEKRENKVIQRNSKQRKLMLRRDSQQSKVNVSQTLKSQMDHKESAEKQQNLRPFQKKTLTEKKNTNLHVRNRRKRNLIRRLLYKPSELVPAEMDEEKKSLYMWQETTNKKNIKKELYNTYYKQKYPNQKQLFRSENQKTEKLQKDNRFLEQQNSNKKQFSVPENQKIEKALPLTAPLQADQSNEKKILPKNRKLNKLHKKVKKTEQKLKKQQASMPYRYRLKFEKGFDNNVGKLKGHLKLEKEMKPQGKQNLLINVSKKVTGTAAKEVISAMHNKIRTTEKDNVGIEAAHKAEQHAENSITSMVYRTFRKAQNRPYKQLSRLERQMQKVNTKYACQKTILENPALQNKLFARLQQKRKIKKRYAKSYRQTQKASSTMKEAFSSGGKVVKATSQFIMRHSLLFATLGIITVLFFLISTGLTSCSSMTTGGISAIVNTSYLAEDKDMNEAEKYYCNLEEELQIEIDNVEEDHPGFDRYRYKIDNIGHNPFELMSYLTAEFNDFQVGNIKYTLSDIFKEQYDLYFVPSTETKTDSEGNTYVITILTTYLDVTPLEDVFERRLDDDEKKERYQAYLQTKGNRQYFNSPFAFDWIPYVTEIDKNNNVKMTVPEETEILAGKDGIVKSTGYTVIIEDKKGYKAVYSGLSTCNVTYGEKVKAGDVIGTTEKKIELLYSYKKQTLNPYFFIATLGSGVPGSPNAPIIPSNPGTPMGDGSYDALIAEAEKHLGRSYVWGGSTPETSFDCSGFVCWVFTHSGVYDLPRTTAQGIFNQCTPVSPDDAQPGDIITFTNTYSTPNPVSHIGIYVGNGMMIHCGDPISYANINSPYWRNHFYSFGRLN